MTLPRLNVWTVIKKEPLHVSHFEICSELRSFLHIIITNTQNLNPKLQLKKKKDIFFEANFYQQKVQSDQENRTTLKVY